MTSVLSTVTTRVYKYIGLICTNILLVLLLLLRLTVPLFRNCTR